MVSFRSIRQGMGDAYARYRCAGLRVVAITAVRLTGCNVCEAFVTTQVDQGVQEAEEGHAGAEPGVVQKCNDASSDGRCCRSTAAGRDLAALEYGVAARTVRS
jgi:hypothetical protein